MKTISDILHNCYHRKRNILFKKLHKQLYGYVPEGSDRQASDQENRKKEAIAKSLIEFLPRDLKNSVWEKFHNVNLGSSIYDEERNSLVFSGMASLNHHPNNNSMHNTFADILGIINSENLQLPPLEFRRANRR